MTANYMVLVTRDDDKDWGYTYKGINSVSPNSGNLILRNTFKEAYEATVELLQSIHDTLRIKEYYNESVFTKTIESAAKSLTANRLIKDYWYSETDEESYYYVEPEEEVFYFYAEHASCKLCIEVIKANLL